VWAGACPLPTRHESRLTPSRWLDYHVRARWWREDVLLSRIGFGLTATSGDEVRQARLLIRSIKCFGGPFREANIWLAMPANKPLAPNMGFLMEEPGISTVPYYINPAARRFPNADRVYAAAALEVEAAQQVEQFVWMDPNTIVARPPRELIMPNRSNFGYRPVDLALFGSPIDEPVDGFWQSVNELCGIPDTSDFSVTTVVDDMRIRPFFDAGLIVVRPQSGLLRAWRQSFDSTFAAFEFHKWYATDPAYARYMYQAALTGVLSRVSEENMLELAPSLNYPLHLHSRYPHGTSDDITEFTTYRYENFAALDWSTGGYPLDRRLQSFIDQEIQAMNHMQIDPVFDPEMDFEPFIY